MPSQEREPPNRSCTKARATSSTGAPTDSRGCFDPLAHCPPRRKTNWRIERIADCELTADQQKDITLLSAVSSSQHDEGGIRLHVFNESRFLRTVPTGMGVNVES
jgi:hypothetical protein